MKKLTLTHHWRKSPDLCRNKKLTLTYLLFALLASCGAPVEKSKTVSVSILPQRYFIERIAGDFVTVNVMIPPGSDPHSADMTPEQLKQLYKSSLYFAIGFLPFEETHIYPLLETLPDIEVINHSKGLDLLAGSCCHETGDHHHHAHGEADHHHDHHHATDPHIWMSPRHAKGMAREIADVLTRKFPQEKEHFQRNYEQLATEIDSLDQEARRIIEAKQEKSFLIYHPALAYFAADYGMEQIAIEHEGKEPHPAHLKEVIDLCREKGIRVIFIQHQFDMANAKTIAKEISGEVIPIDPLNPDWKGEMRALLQVIDTKMN